MAIIGDKAHNFKLYDQNGNLVSLSDFLGRKVVLFFYPKDSTPGCTAQACNFRDATNQFKEIDVQIIGISEDKHKSHQNFSSKYNLQYPILSDENKDAIEAYGVLKNKMLYGKTFLGISRTTFIIDEKGYIEKVFNDVNPKEDAKVVLDYLSCVK
jgi:peroxiredoxin Q/BCP